MTDRSTKPVPAWAPPYFRYSAWSQSEFVNLLCGFPPSGEHLPVPADPKERQTWNDAWQRDELRRLQAERHVRDAILAGELSVVEPLDDHLIEKIRSHVTSVELEQLRQAVVHSRTCARAYRFAVEMARQWAEARPKWFPDFPHVVLETEDSAIVVTRSLKEHRRSLITRALEKNDVERAEFLKAKGIKEDTIRGWVNGDRHRVGHAKEAKLFRLFGISRHEWNTPP